MLNEKKPVTLLAKWMPSINTSSQSSKSWAKFLITCFDWSEKQYRQTLSKLREYPTLDQLACWEHRRWNNFHYASGYIGYDPDPSNKGQLKPYPVENGDMIYGKVHNCLIDDWEELKRNETSVTTVIYDIYAIYAIFSKNKY